MGVKIILNPLRGDRLFLKVGEQVKGSNVRFDTFLKLRRSNFGVSFWIVPKGLLPVLQSIVDLPVEIAEKADSGQFVLIEDKNKGKYLLYPLDGIEVQEVGILKDQEKREYKVYETPEQILDIVAKTIARAYFEELRNIVREKIEANLVSVLKEPSLARNIILQFENNKEKTLGDLKRILNEKDYQKVMNHLSKYDSFLKTLEEENYPKLFEIGKAITNRELKDFTKEYFKIPIFDFQAGSGRILNSFKKLGLSALLFGTEVRDIKELRSKEENNKVLYGVDFNIASEFIRNSFRKNLFRRQIGYLNPPYFSNREVERKSIEILPEGIPVLGLFSYKAKKLLSANIEGLIIELPKDVVGYEESESPEKFLFVIGVKNKKLTKKQKIVSANSLEEIIPLIEKNKDVLNSFFREVFKAIQEANRLSRNFVNYERIESEWESIEVFYRNLMDRVKRITKIKPENIINNPVISLKEGLFSGAKIFPDLRVVNSNRKYSLQEVLQNPVILKTYEQFVPELYRFILDLAKEKNLSIAISEESPYTTTESLGLMKYKHYPKAFPVKIVEEIVGKYTDELGLSEEDIKILKKVLEHGKLAGIKARPTLSTQGGEIAFGYTSTLSIMDGKGRDIAIVDVNLSKFFEILEKEGIVKANYKLAEPDIELKEKMLKNYIRNIEETKKFFKIEGKEVEKFKDIYTTLEQATGKLVSLLKRETKKEDLISLFDRVSKDLGIENEPVYKESVRRFQNAKTSQEIVYTFKKLYGYLYNKIFEELLKSEIARRVKDKIQSEILKLSDIETEIKDSIRNSLKAEGREELFYKLEAKIDKLIKEFKERPFVFTYLQDKDDIERYINDPTVEWSKKEKLKELPVYPQGSKGYISQKLGDASLAEAFLSGASAYISLEDKVRASIRRLFTQIFEVEILKQIENPEKAFERFEKLFINKLGVKKHQFYEALRLNAKHKLDNTKGHLLGWEMRSGKTLAMFLSGYFAYLGHEIKETFIFPKTANISDILLQMTEFLPQMLPAVKSYRVSTIDIPLRSNLVGEFLSTDIYPNLLAIPEIKKMLVGRGETQKILGESYVKDMEELIDTFRTDKNTLLKAKKVIEEDKDLKSILFTDLSDEVKVATAIYLKRLKENGLIKFDRKNLQGLIDKLSALAKKIKAEEKVEEQHKDKPFRVHIIPKTALDSVAYKLKRDYKYLNTIIPLKIKNDINFISKFDNTSKSQETFDGWYCDANITRNYTQFLHELEETFERFKKDFLGENKEKIVEYLGLESEEVFNLIKDVKLNVEFKEFYKIKLKRKENEKVEDVITNVMVKFDVEGLNGKLKEDYLQAFVSYLNGNGVITSASGLVGRVFTFAEEIGRKKKGNLKNEFYTLVKKKVGSEYIPEIDVVLNEISAVPLVIKRLRKDKLVSLEGFTLTPYTIEYKDGIDKKIKVYDSLNLRLNIASPSNFIFEVEVPEAPQIFEYPQAFAKVYFYHSKAFENRNFVAIVDEADEAINPDAQKFRAFLSIAKNSKIAIASTGTPTSGDVKTPVALLGLVNGMDVETIKEAMKNVEENFSTYKFVKNNILIQAFLSVASNILFTGRNPNNFWKKILLSTPEAYGVEDIKHLTEGIEDVVNILLEYNKDKEGNTIDYEVEYQLNKFRNMLSSEITTIKGFIKFVNDLSKYLTEKQLDFREGLIQYLEQSKDKSISPGTFDPIGFVSVLTGSVSFQTRENLKRLSDPNVKEEIIIEDINNLYATVFKNFEELKLSDEFKRKNVSSNNNLEDLLALSKVSVSEEIEEYNKMFNFDANLREINDIGVVKYIGYTQIPKIRAVMEIILNGIEDTVRRDAEKIMAILSIDGLTEKELKDAVSPSGVSVNDNLKNIIIEMVYNDYNFDKVSLLKAEDTEKQKLLNLKREVAEVVWDFVGNLTVQILNAKTIDEIFDILNKKGLNGYIDFTLVLEILGKDKQQPFFEFSEGRFYIDGEEVKFNFQVKFTNPDWNEVLKEPYAYTYNFRIAGGDSEEIIDVANNKGFKEIYANLAKEGRSFLVAPSRVPTLAVSILDTIAYLYRYKPEGKDYQVFVRITDKSIEEVLKRLDVKKLKEKGITVKSFKNHNLLDLEVKKFSKEVKGGKLGMVVIAPAKTISRGVDLSMLDTIVVPGTVQGSGKDFAQLIARTFNNTDKHKTSVYLFGTPVRINYYKVFNNEFVSFSAQYTSLVQSKLLKKYEFIKSMMSGKLLNILDKTNSYVAILDDELKNELKEEEPQIGLNVA